MSAVLNISAYRFVPIDEPLLLVRQLQALLSRTALLGTVLVAPEGINLFLAGRAADIHILYDYFRADPRFMDMDYKESWSDSVPFARLVVKAKAEIIRMNLPYDPSLYSPALPARLFKQWLDQGADNDGQPLLVLDTRNAFEYAYGHFEQAVHLSLETFSEFPSQVHQLAAHLGKTVVAYCTGGVRCEKVGAALRAAGFHTAYQLQGGILRYFEEVGGAHYVGSCFVFDDRLCLDSENRPVVGARHCCEGA